MSTFPVNTPKVDVARFNRRGQRVRIEARGVIKLGWFKTYEVELRDVSPGGARVVVPEGLLLPDEFQIRLPQFKHPRTCYKRWESGLEIGVEFKFD
jgi:PilZ domain